jgi:hypothetical protein
MNLLGTGSPRWPPGVRKTQTSETQLRVFRAYFDMGMGDLGDEGARFMVAGGQDMRNGMTEEERDKCIKGMARVAQNNSMQLIEGLAEQVGKELSEELERQKKAVKIQQEQIQTQQGQIQQLLDMVKTLNGGAPPLLSAMMEGAEGAAKRKEEREVKSG